MYWFTLFLYSFFCCTNANPVKNGKDPREQYLVTDLLGFHENIPVSEDILMFSGQLELYKENNTHYFFWKFSDNSASKTVHNRLIFWLNGGPGCSSMDGALMEAGPFRIGPDKKVIYNNGSWHKSAEVVFVDQPAGTGFSYSDNAYDKELYDISNDFLTFLNKYFEVFPEDRQKEIYLAGESYAGQYIPYIADGILKWNEMHTESIKLKGLLIGNGWVSPVDQSLSYLPYALAAGFLERSNPMMGEILAQHEKCQNELNNIDRDNYQKLNAVSNACERILDLILKATLDTEGPDDEKCVNMYDYTLRDSFPSCGMNWPPDLKNVYPFLRSERVMSDLNLIYQKKWSECSSSVSRHLKVLNSPPAVVLLPSILEKIPVMLFNGNRDIICNYIGTEAYLKDMIWNEYRGFPEDTEKLTWIFENQTAGYIKSSRNLTFVNVFDASHMVPFDKPEVSRSLIDLMTGDFEIGETYLDNKKVRAIFTSSDSRNAALNDDEKTGQSSHEEINSSESTNSDKDSDTSSEIVNEEEYSETEEDSEHKSKEHSNLTTRILQVSMGLVLLWGIYALIASYKARPSSIIKSRPSSKKKNVQWADQLRRFEDQEIAKNEQGIISRAFSKFKRNDHVYSPVEGKLFENIEMQNAEQSTDLSGSANENFVIGDEENI